MPRPGILDPRYVYKPWTAKRRARRSIAARKEYYLRKIAKGFNVGDMVRDRITGWDGQITAIRKDSVRVVFWEHDRAALIKPELATNCLTRADH